MLTLQDLNWIQEKIDHVPMKDRTLVEMKEEYDRYLSVSEKLGLLLDDHPVDEEKYKKEEKKVDTSKGKKAPEKKTNAKK